MTVPHRQIAFARIVLPDGRVLERQIVQFDGRGTPVGHRALTHEEPFTEWHNETYRWPAEPPVV